MSEIKDKLDSDWAELTTDKNAFAIRAIVEELYHALSDAITRGQELYPTGDTTFDNYVGPIVTELQTFKTGLENNYADFINWRQP